MLIFEREPVTPTPGAKVKNAAKRKSARSGIEGETSKSLLIAHGQGC